LIKKYLRIYIDAFLSKLTFLGAFSVIIDHNVISFLTFLQFQLTQITVRAARLCAYRTCSLCFIAVVVALADGLIIDDNTALCERTFEVVTRRIFIFHHRNPLPVHTKEEPSEIEQYILHNILLRGRCKYNGDNEAQVNVKFLNILLNKTKKIKLAIQGNFNA